MNNFQPNRRKSISTLVSASHALFLLTLLLFGSTVLAASHIEDITAEGEITAVEPIEPLPANELGDVVAPIALYPDDLLAIVLPASTYPIQIVQAARFLEARDYDPTLEPAEDWDDSIIALLNYPEVIALLNDNLDWTWQLGAAVLIQESDVIAAVSDFRERARIAGNLESDEHQIVEVDDEGAIEIVPADPEVIYVPYYEPAQVTVYQPYPVYYYYPRAYPVYYYPYPAGYRFSTGFFWGVTSAFTIGWNTHRVHLHHYGYRGHPYYDRYYYDPIYYRRPHRFLSHDYDGYYHRNRNRHDNHRHHAGNYWAPDREHAGARPRDHHHDYRDQRDQRRFDHDQVNRGQQHVAAEPQARRTQRHVEPQHGSRSTESRTTRDGVRRLRSVRETTASHRPRAEDRGVGRSERPPNDVRRAAPATRVRAEDGERRPAPGARGPSRERVVRVVEPSTSARERRVESRRPTTVAAADVRPPRAKPARSQQTSAQTPRAHEARAPSRPTTPAKEQQPPRESRAKVVASSEDTAHRGNSGKKARR